jgi:hypothetical protein
MTTTLRSNGYIPANQPYNVDPWNFGGPENLSPIPANVVDWILIEIRSGTAASFMVTRRAGFLKSDGAVTDLDGQSPLGFDNLSAGDYYIVLHHRNHLPVMSAAPVSLTTGSSNLYDFTSSSSQFYGTGGAKDLGSGEWGMMMGDANATGWVNSADYLRVKIDLGSGGYYFGDCNLNGLVDTDDYLMVKPNIGKETLVP